MTKNQDRKFISSNNMKGVSNSRMKEEELWKNLENEMNQLQKTHFDIPEKKCPLCGSPLITHPIRAEAVIRFIKSKDSMYNNVNVVWNYLKTLLETSRKSTAKDLMRICWILRRTPKQIIEEAKKDKEAFKTLLDELDSFFISYFKNPAKRPVLTKYTVKSLCKSLAGFLKKNGVYGKEKLFPQVFTMHIPKQHTYTPSKEDLKLLYSRAKTIRDKTLVQFLTCLPLRRRELLRVKWSDIDLSEEYPLLVIEDVRLKGRGKGKYQKVVFAGVVCENLRRLLRELKEKEKARFERVRQEEIERLMEQGHSKEEAEKMTTHLEWSEDLPIFLSSDNILNKKTGVREIKCLSVDGLSQLFKYFQREIGLPIHPHSFRYFCETIVINKLGQACPYVDLILAHKFQGTRSRYQEVYRDKKKMREWFKKIEADVDLELAPKRKEELAKQKFKELLSQGKDPMKAFEETMEIMKQMLIKDFMGVKEALEVEVKKAEERYRKLYKE